MNKKRVRKNRIFFFFEKKNLFLFYIVSGRFMDFHLTLLKKISPGKTIERNQFVSNMTKVNNSIKLSLIKINDDI